MASRAFPLPRPLGARAGTLANVWRDALLMLGLAAILRCWWFGNPFVQVDEQFYLLVGDRLLHGALPYVDIWDRKPIGLFLLYAGVRTLGGTGILQYQIVATLFAGATAFLVVQLARSIASPTAARLAGAASLIFTIVFDGAGGQAPVFYNPLVAGAALIVLRALATPPAEDRRFVAQGALAMALIGIAIQIKYTALFEGVTMGLALLWTARRRGIDAHLPGIAALWIAIAILPTLLAFAAYAAAGHGEAFAYANFVSIGDRPGTAAYKLGKRLAAIVALGLPLIAAAAVGLRVRQRSDEAQRARLFLLVWLIGAVIGFFALGSLYKHYALPLVAPLAVFAAPAFDVGRRDRWRAIVVLGLGLAIAVGMSAVRLRARGGEQQSADLVAAIRPHLTDRLFVFDGEPALYLLTGAKLASPYAFPNHLNQKKESHAIGTDQSAELRRVIASRPSVVVVTDRPGPDRNPVAWNIMRAALVRDYRQVGAVRFHRKWRLVFALKA
ncbi:glycosyltransferase family 39 protein [Sphingomonas sp. BIUV-7]|uniref:Glycosyltransferase family 39 protein n=1 Tax=Sphingomonas natans TaxID=3063330 RepID=A0ABT8Y9R1_9SPHN|nr:glycosyltransferase family 39 protein [Sphingomonas sp. BIUV-7]MDO6415070.1 glycosyltransferase family 39 protein [Sphingomonas sp. BIUV-7]